MYRLNPHRMYPIDSIVLEEGMNGTASDGLPFNGRATRYCCSYVYMPDAKPNQPPVTGQMDKAIVTVTDSLFFLRNISSKA